jgi:curli biogenesis system outer membrane secretion channel CsgG
VRTNKVKIATSLTISLSILGLISSNIGLLQLALPTAVYAQGTEQLQVKTKKRVAVLDFEFASTGLTGSGFSLFGAGGPAKGISDLITNSLVKNGTYIVIERSRIQEVLKEQNLGASGRIEATTAAQIGRALGADILIIGTVNRFNLESNTSGTNVFGFGSTNTKNVAEVKLAVRMVGTTTGEIIVAADGAGTEEQNDSTTIIGGLGGSASATNNTDKLLSSASEKAVEQVVTQLAAASATVAALPSVLPNVTAVVADVSGKSLTLNKGGRDGFKPGMIVFIERIVKEIKDPSTGKVLRMQTSRIGRVQLTEVDGASAVGKVLTGKGFKVGDIAKPAEN